MDTLNMMKRLLLPLLLLALASPAQALKLIVWDSEMQTKLGAGESSGTKLNIQLVKDYSGPVKVIFSQSNDEKAKNAFIGLQNSYDGLLKNGQLNLLIEDAADSKMSVASSAAVPGQSAAVGTPLAKFLQQFKLSLTAQTTGRGAVSEPLLLSSRAK